MSRSTHTLLIILLTLTIITGVAAQSPGDFRSEDVTFQNGEVTLAGTLTLPLTDGPYPAVVLVSGSGPQDRNESLQPIADIQPFALIAEYLTPRGFAVLRYDDRGVGQSTGDFWAASTLDFASDAEAALNYLLSREDINEGQMGVLGHSEGGIIAPMIAARNADVDYIISLAGTGVNGYEITLLQERRILTAAGMPSAQIETSIEQMRQAMDLNLAEDWDGLEQFLRDMATDQVNSMSEEARSTVDIETIVKTNVNNARNWQHFFFTYDPAEAWAQVQVPALILFGGRDTQVDAAQSAPPIVAALAAAGHTDYTVKVFPTANHLFQEAQTGSPMEYGELEQTFIPELLPTITDWLLEQTGIR